MFKLDNFNQFCEDARTRVIRTSNSNGEERYSQADRNQFRRDAIESLAKDLGLVETTDGFMLLLDNNELGNITLEVSLSVKAYSYDTLEEHEMFLEEKARKALRQKTKKA